MKISKSDFRFHILSYGRYKVTYCSPVTQKEHSTIVTNMELIDATKNTEHPKSQDLNILKRYCKQNLKLK